MLTKLKEPSKRAKSLSRKISAAKEATENLKRSLNSSLKDEDGNLSDNDVAMREEDLASARPLQPGCAQEGCNAAPPPPSKDILAGNAPPLPKDSPSPIKDPPSSLENPPSKDVANIANAANIANVANIANIANVANVANIEQGKNRKSL
jgi:hypothetical protein